MSDSSRTNPILNSLKYVTLVRSLYALLVLFHCFLWLLRARISIVDHETALLLGCVIEIFLFTTIISVFMLRQKYLNFLTYLGIAHDSLLATFFILLTGLSHSPFAYLLLIVPLYGGIILQRKGGIIAASCVSFSLFFFLFAFPDTCIDLLSLDPTIAKQKLTPSFLICMILAAYCVGVLTGHLSHLYASVSHSLSKTDDELKDFKDFYALMLNALPIGIVIHSCDAQKILYFNPSAKNLLGESLEIPKQQDLSGEYLSAKQTASLSIEPTNSASTTPNPMHPQNDETDDKKNAPLSHEHTLIANIRDMHRIPKIQNDSHIEWTASVNQKYLHIVQFSLSVHQTQLTGYHIIDFTAQILEQKERARRARLEHLGEFSAKVAHEIRNPLACISGCNEMLELDAQTPQQKQIHQMMDGEISRLNCLLNDILLFARNPKLHPKPLKLKAIIESQKNRFLESAQHKNITFDISVPDDIIFTADEASLRQILMTLWQNASEAMNGSGAIALHTTPNHALSIADSGPGIPANVLPHLFEPFYTTKPDGTGLGLATARQLAIDNNLSLDWSESKNAFILTRTSHSTEG